MGKDSDVIKINKNFLIMVLFFLLVNVVAFYIFYNVNSSANKPNVVQNVPSISDKTSLFVSYAKDLNLDKSKFEQCLKSGKYEEEVLKDHKLGNSLQVRGTPTFFINDEPLEVGASPYEVFKEVLDKKLLVAEHENGRDVAIKMVYPSDPVRGDKNAKVIMFEFSDFQCPFCARFFSGAESQIMKDYVDTGKVLFVYKDFPLMEIHPYAKKAAESGNCAAEQGKFWEYHDILFQKQSEWSK